MYGGVQEEFPDEHKRRSQRRFGWRSRGDYRRVHGSEAFRVGADKMEILKTFVNLRPPPPSSMSNNNTWYRIATAVSVPDGTRTIRRAISKDVGTQSEIRDSIVASLIARRSGRVRTYFRDKLARSRRHFPQIHPWNFG